MSTVDRILALHVLNGRLRDLRTGLLASYVNLGKAFDPVNRDLLRRILTLRGIPPKLVNGKVGLRSSELSASLISSLLTTRL